jgi:1-deoxy-D-xylulose-5-phosphate reductoisomerase
MKKISILGATGSIGQNTLDLITSTKDKFEVVALTGSQNIKLIAQSAIDSNAKIVATSDESKFNELKEILSGRNIKVLGGKNGILEASSAKVDWVMSAIVGSAGLLPGLTAMQAGANVALANKESMVAAGSIMKKVSQERGVKLLPVDSEHSAVSQVIRGEDRETLEKIIITASGGAFRNRSIEELEKVTPYEASQHPNWDMGQRITIDSASLFNKALEIIEAKEFFNLNHSEINVLIHPQSIVHAIACFHDQGMKAHLGPADMKHAIAYALHEEKRFRLPLKEINLSEIGTLNFFEPDVSKYPALELGFNVIRHGGLAGAAFNAAKEEALDNFLNLKLSFLGMSDVVSATMDELTASNKLDQVVELEAVMEIDLLARSVAKQYVEKY